MELLPFAQVYFLYHKINFLFSIMLAVDCGSLEDPLDGHVDATKGTLFTNMSVYSCNLGHHLFGCSVVECQANGTWSCDPPFCAGEFHRRFPLCIYSLSITAMIQLKFGPTSHCVDWKVRLFTN